MKTARWSGVLLVEGELTGDGRLLEHGAIRWDEDDLPMTLRVVFEDNGMHDGAVDVASIEKLERRDGGIIWGEGEFDVEAEVGQEAARLVRKKLKNGVSADLDDVSFEIRVASELVEAREEMLSELLEGDGEADDQVEVRQTDESGDYVVVATINSDDEIQAVTSARFRAATIVSIPAFVKAKIGMAAEDAEAEPEVAPEPTDTDTDIDDTEESVPDLALVASGYPDEPPMAWFRDPELTAPTPLTVTKDGRVYGHLATWDSCHLSHTAAGQCVTPPRSATNYSYFRSGSLVTAEGEEIAVGPITTGTGHATTKRRLTPAAVLAHYDNTGSAAADVNIGEDHIGIWVAGGLRSTCTKAQVRELRAAKLSGDWRRVGMKMELVAALAVNVPGYGVPRTSGLVASGHLEALVASGVVDDTQTYTEDPDVITDDDLRYLKAMAERERAAHRRRVDAFALRRRVGR